MSISNIGYIVRKLHRDIRVKKTMYHEEIETLKDELRQENRKCDLHELMFQNKDKEIIRIHRDEDEKQRQIIIQQEKEIEEEENLKRLESEKLERMKTKKIESGDKEGKKKKSKSKEGRKSKKKN